jgi:choline-sulfatase
VRFVYLDIDTLRADHLGCYGYHRDTSPNIDALAASGWRFDEMYVSDSPCLPSRSALITGRFGVTNGVVNHGGERAEPFPEGASRRRQSELASSSWPGLLRETGMWCTTISTFAERHSAFHWYAGFNEAYNLGTSGRERADEVSAVAIDWLQRRGQRDDWFLHVHFWDPHTPYRTPLEWGDPFRDDRVPAWIDDDVLARHWQLAGPHSAQEVTGFAPDLRFDEFPRQPQQIADSADVRRMFDGYDAGIRYADEHVGLILAELAALGIEDETAIVVSSDHGETLGELGIYCDHQTADLHTHRVPAVVRWPGLDAGRTDHALRYQVDLAATVVELLGGTVPPSWDGHSFAAGLRDVPGADEVARDHLVLSCGAWATQRAVRFDEWLCIRTYHDAFHGFAPVMLFDVERDPHEQVNVADDHPDVVGRAARLLLDWEAASMERSPSGVDPLWTVIREGGGYYTRGRLENYLMRLCETGRDEWAERIASTLTASMPQPGNANAFALRADQ